MNPRQFLHRPGMKDRNILPLGCISPFRSWWVAVIRLHRPPSAVFRKKCTTCSSWPKWAWLLHLLTMSVVPGSTGGDPWNMSTCSTNHWIWVDQRLVRLMADSKLPGFWLLLPLRLPPSPTWWRSISVYVRLIIMLVVTMRTAVAVCSYSPMSRIRKRILHPVAPRMTPLRADPSKWGRLPAARGATAITTVTVVMGTSAPTAASATAPLPILPGTGKPIAHPPIKR